MYCDDLGHCHDSIYTEKPKNVFKVREVARQKAIELAVKRYFDGMEGAKNLRLYGERRQKPISNQQYQALVKLHKTELGKILSGLVRKGDVIKMPPRE